MLQKILSKQGIYFGNPAKEYVEILMDNIIAEVGLNHNGSLNLALEYVDRLKQLDINAIKFQLSNPNKLYSKESFKAKYQKLFDNSTNPLEMSKKYQDYQNLIILLYQKSVKKIILSICAQLSI